MILDQEDIKALAEAMAPLVAAEVIKRILPQLTEQQSGEVISLTRQMEIRAEVQEEQAKSSSGREQWF